MIDLMGHIVWTKVQIENRMQALINARHSPQAREQALRTGQGKPALDVFFTDMATLKAQAVTDNRLLADTLAYEAAQRCLAQYVLLEGRPEQIAVDAVYNEQGTLVSEAVPYIAPIEPLPEFVDQTTVDIDGVATTTNVRNPLIVTDEFERTEAQTLIDGAGVAVTDLWLLRQAQ